MPRRPSLATIDKALVAVAGVASKSAKLSSTEKRELRALAAKGAKSGRQGWTITDRARCIWLLRKAGPENVPIPEWVRNRIGSIGSTSGNADHPSPPVRRPLESD